MLLNYKKLLTCSILLVTPVLSFANSQVTNNFIQSIQVVNLLANDTLEDVGMTPTGIIVRYFNGGNNPCWTSTLTYRQDATIHAGPTQGCQAKVSRIEIMPVVAFDKLKTYQGPLNVAIDTTKYANQITVIQDQPPTFDTNNGLVTLAGSMQAKVQAQFQA